ncbi:MAG: cyclase family protein [Minisyncoccia bacterium]
MKIIDISLPIYSKMIVYPGNPSPEFFEIKTKTSYISRMILGTHTGTHIDAPRHINKKGEGVDKIKLEKLIGSAKVLDLTKVKISIQLKDLKKFQIKKGERILAKTSNSLRGFKKFYNDYIFLSAEAAKFLADKKISLFGIDSLSVKQKGSPDNRPHEYLLKNNIPIFEGLNLSKVKAGNYFFIGLPLNLKGLDGAPARAVLLK